MAHLGDHGALDGQVEIGVLEHDQRSIAAEFHPNLEDAIGAALEQDLADSSRTGERHHAGGAMLGGSIEPLARGACGDNVDETGWHACLFEKLGDTKRRERCFGRRLDDARIAGGERRSDLARDHRRRKVPWGDHHDDPDRRVVNDDLAAATGGGLDHAVDANGLFAVPTEELGGIGNLALRVGQWLAVFERDQGGELVGVRD